MAVSVIWARGMTTSLSRSTPFSTLNTHASSLYNMLKTGGSQAIGATGVRFVLEKQQAGSDALAVCVTCNNTTSFFADMNATRGKVRTALLALSGNPITEAPVNSMWTEEATTDQSA